MDQRISYVSNLKSHISKRHSVASPHVVAEEEEEKDCEEDVEYVLSRGEVLESEFFGQSNKHVRIRMEKWIDCLDKIKVNKVWKTNRNNYIKLLKLMCQCEYLVFPFNALPSPTDLPTLKKHEINKIIDEVEREVKASRQPSRRMSCLLNSQGMTTPKHKQSATATNILQPQEFDIKRFRTYDSNSIGEEDSLTLPMKLMQIQKERTFQTDFDKTMSFARHSSIRKMEKGYDSSKGNQSLSFIKRQDESIQTKIESKIDEIRTKAVRYNSRSRNNENSRKDLSFTNTNYDSRPSLQSYQSKEPLEPILLRELNKTIPKLPPTHSKMAKNTNKVEGPTKRKEVDKQNDGESKQEREYWQSNSWTGNNTGNGTPKYLDNYILQPNLHIEQSQSVEMISYRSHEAEICECAPLTDNWFTKLFSAN